MNALLATLKDPNAAAHAVDHLDIEDLRDLMRSVTETTERLQQTHTALKDQVARLQRELAEANEQLRRSQSLAALGEMAAGIAHEVRNPLGSIQLYVQVLREELRDRPEQASICEKVERAVVGLDGIVRDVLLFARRIEISAEPTTAADLFDRALSQCQSLINSPQVAAPVNVVQENELDESFQADVALLTQALGNVLRNAVEAINAHGEIAGQGQKPRQLSIGATRKRVRCPDGRRATRVVLAVQDTGPGITPEVLERMFNPFFTTRKTGTGLGLAIVHRIVDAHGGDVSVHNVNGGGARVELRLPEAPVPPEDANAPVGEASCEIHIPAGANAAGHHAEKRA